MDLFSDDYFLRKVLKEAEKAFNSGEVPVVAAIECEKNNYVFQILFYDLFRILISSSKSIKSLGLPVFCFVSIK